MPIETSDDFKSQVEPLRRSVQAHCYRMLGSLHDAEDVAQETMLRAWSRRHTFEGRAQVKTWLHRIATNACLDFVDARRSRTLPSELGPPARAGTAPAPPSGDHLWLSPCPGWLVAATEPGPEAQYTARESVQLAFLVALQVLPPRQRAVLLLRDVLGWSANETAEALDLSVAAANSALQRARETLAARQGAAPPTATDATEDVAAVVKQYVQAWEQADLRGLVQLLHAEVALAMPPMPTWFLGKESVGGFFGQMLVPAARGRIRMVETTANGLPALASYAKDDATGRFLPMGITLLSTERGQVRRIETFLDPGLFAKFELAPQLG